MWILGLKELKMAMTVYEREMGDDRHLKLKARLIGQLWGAVIYFKV